MTRSRPAALAALSLLALLAAPLAAQAPAGADGGATLVGRVVRDGRPVPDVPVALHRVTSDSSGVLDSAVTDAAGGFSFALPPAGGADFTVFFATADYLGVRYFGQPVHPDERPAEYAVAVSDTASTLPEPVRVARRDVVMIPISNGGWEIDEVVSVFNPSDRTLVSGDGGAVWEMGIPEEVVEIEFGEGDICATEMQQMDDRVLLTTPLVPGTCNLFFRYLIPPLRGGFELPVTAPTDTFNLYVRQPAPPLELEGLGAPSTITAEGETYLRYETLALDGSRGFDVEWTVEGIPPVDPVLAGVVAATLVLLLGGAAALRLRARDR